ncbi:MAG: abortive infection family protein [Gammaproteobacteria bacterium]|nr:abortive infection family protein [Gammaproteobacteria bacterium]MDA8003211.1 abortive infection family protein [Alphaproteobacteria bacterium]
MSQDLIPNAVIAAVSKALDDRYTDADVEGLFMSAGAPADPPNAPNKRKRYHEWMRICNRDPSINAHVVLGELIKEYMEEDPWNDAQKNGQISIRKALAQNQLSYHAGGVISLAGVSLATRTLEDILNENDFPTIENAFRRGLSSISTEPHAAVSAASEILEAACKLYLKKFNIEIPPSQKPNSLVNQVRKHLFARSGGGPSGDTIKIWSGLISAADGIGAFRTHTGTVHGHAEVPPITSADAQLAVSAAHTLVVFIMKKMARP